MKYCVAHILGKKWANAIPVLNLILGSDDGMSAKDFVGVPDDQLSIEIAAKNCASDGRLLLTRLPPLNIERPPTLQILAASKAQVLILDDTYFATNLDVALTSLAKQAQEVKAALNNYPSSILLSEKLDKSGLLKVAAIAGQIQSPILKTLSARDTKKRKVA